MDLASQIEQRLRDFFLYGPVGAEGTLPPHARPRYPLLRTGVESVGAALVRHRDAHALHLRAGRTLHWAPCLCPLYLTLLLLAAVVLSLLSFWTPTTFATSTALHFSIFVALATIYPNVELFLRDHGKVDRPNIRCDRDAKRAGNARLAEPRRARTSISAAFLFIELRGARPELAWWNALKERITPKPKYHVVPKTAPRRPAESDDVYSSIDPILDRITKFGIGSLTPSERRQLNREREQLLKKSE